jgi:hypothetical protein
MDGYPGAEHSYPISPLFKDVVQTIAQSGITNTPTLLVNYGGPWTENYWYEHYDIHKDAKLMRFTPHEEIDRRAAGYTAPGARNGAVTLDRNTISSPGGGCGATSSASTTPTQSARTNTTTVPTLAQTGGGLPLVASWFVLLLVAGILSVAGGLQIVLSGRKRA